MTNKDIDDILSNFQAWDTCGSRSCEHFNNFERDRQKLNEAYGKQFLELLRLEPIDPADLYMSLAGARNELRVQLRQAIKDKYLREAENEPKPK